jgi:hypothetical protein
MGRPPRRSAASIVDDRILTSRAAMCARMDGWWTLPSGEKLLHDLSRKKGSDLGVRFDAQARSHGSIT